MTHYQISRNGQMYGPYTLEDLQRYLASGNVLASDLAKSDEMSEWIPVSQLLGAGAVSPATGFTNPDLAAPTAPANAFSNPGYADPAYAAPAQPWFNAAQHPDAPNLNWGLVLLIDVFTCGIFQYVWNIIVAAWLKKVQPNSKGLILYIAVVVVLAVYFVLSIPAQMTRIHAAMNHSNAPAMPGVALGLVYILLFVVRLVARFVQRASLEEHFNTVENVGLRLNPVMTFFFGGLYFQYHLNKINAYKLATRMNQPPAY